MSDSTELVFAADIYRNDAVAAAALDTSSMNSAPVRFASLTASSRATTETMLR
jgi:hypothetical protein